MYSLVVSLWDNIKGKQVKAVTFLLFLLLDSYETFSDVMCPQRKILYFLFPSHANHDLVSKAVFWYSGALELFCTPLNLQKALPVLYFFPSWSSSLHPTHLSGLTSLGCSASLPTFPVVQEHLLISTWTHHSSLQGILTTCNYSLTGDCQVPACSASA